MTTTHIVYAVYAAAVLIFFGLFLQWLFAAQIDKLMKRYFPDYMTKRALRAEQQSEDRLQEYQRDREVKQRQMLTWAFAHPGTAEGRRHLQKERDEVLKRLERANRDAEHRASMVSYTRGVDKVEYEAELAEATQRQNDEARQLADLDRALNPDDSVVTQ